LFLTEENSQYDWCFPPISGPQLSGLTRCSLGGTLCTGAVAGVRQGKSCREIAVQGKAALLGFDGMILGMRGSSLGWVARLLSTDSESESTLPLLNPMLFPTQGVQWLLWFVHSEFFHPFSTQSSSLMFHLESERQIAPVTCLYTYTIGLNSGFRAVTIQLAQFHTPPCLGIETQMLSSSQQASLPPWLFLEEEAQVSSSITHSPVQGHVWGTLITQLSQNSSKGSDIFVPIHCIWLSNGTQG
jgi:hypothetical protein